MTSTRRFAAALGVLAITLLSAAVPSATVASAAGFQRAHALALPRTQPTPTLSSVSVTLNRVTPRSPDATKPSQPVTFVATLTNNTDSTYSDLRVGLQRGLPITQPRLLTEAISIPPETGFEVPEPLRLAGQLLPRQSVTVTYRTTSGALCLCYNGVYPYAVVVRGVSDPDAGSVELGRTQVLIPSFLDTPKPVTVGWVWPLLDKPHRSVDQNVFTDEQLAGEVGPGGRLDRALEAAELVAGQVRLTLLIDPDLLDSLAVMSSPSGYRVRSGNGTVPGTGGRLAAGWLARLKKVKAKHDVVLTGYADPDVNAVARAGLKWSTALDPQVQARIAPTLDGDFSSDLLTWPAGGALTSKALDALVGGGASTIMLSDAAFPRAEQDQQPADALASLPSAAGEAMALVTNTGIENTTNQILRPGATPQNAQQTLLAQLAIQAEQDPSRGHFVVIVPDRYVDTSPQAAASTILATRDTSWSRAISIRQALRTVRPTDHGALQTNAENPSAEISPGGLQKIGQVQQAVTSMNEALHDNDAAAELLGAFNNGIHRAESSAWRTYPAEGASLVENLEGRIDQLTSSVHLVQPAVGTYSLSSADSPVVVTVSNQLPKPVTVRVGVAAANGVIGFRPPPVETQTIPARSIATIRIPTHVDRLGKFRVIARVSTPDGRQLGQTVTLNLRATSIGTISKIITIVAVTVLILALLRRLVRRVRHGSTHHNRHDQAPVASGASSPGTSGTETAMGATS